MSKVARPVQLFIACSLDGYVAGPRHEIDWLFSDQDYGYTPFYAGVDTLLIGRKTYEVACSFPAWPYAGKDVVVFTRRTPPPDDPRVRFTAETPAAVVRALRAKPGKALWLVGGGELLSAFLNAGLVDDAALAIHPILLGGGVRLVPPGTLRTKLKLKDEVRFDSGLVLLSYDVAR